MNTSPLIALEAWFDIAITEAAIRIAPNRVVSRVVRETDESLCSALPDNDLEIFFEVASRHLIRAACLTRAIALLRFLRRRGVAAELRMGLGGEGAASGHAWVEVDGRPVEQPDEVGEIYGRMEVASTPASDCLTAGVVVSPDVAWQTVAGEAVLVNLTTGVSLGLNETGSFIWTRLADSSLDQIAKEMTLHYGTSFGEALEDTRALVSDLVLRGFVAERASS